jgi:hypothetical protein
MYYWWHDEYFKNIHVAMQAKYKKKPKSQNKTEMLKMSQL